MISATDAEATLKFLVPGFLALKVFYSWGLSWRRTDFEWTVWSLLVSALLAVFMNRLSLNDDQRFLLSIAAALGFGLVLVLVWQAWRLVSPKAGVSLRAQAWDFVFDRPMWVQLRLVDGAVVFGFVAIVSQSAQTDDVDLYLSEPAWVDAETGNRTPMGVEGVLIARSQISLVQVLATDPANFADRAKAWWSGLRLRRSG